MKRIGKNSNLNIEIALEAVTINYKRIKKIASFGIPVSLLHVIYFLFFVTASSVEQRIWRTGIIVAHTSLTIIFTVTLFTISFLKKRNISIQTKQIIQYLCIFLIMLLGSGIVALDQLVTTNITPFLVICTIIALVFLLKPFISASIYLISYLFFYFSMGFTQYDKLVLASNRVNGITAVAISIALSNILWQYFAKDFLQRKLIKQQNIELTLQKKELEEINTKLTLMAAYDSLTGLLNRREFEKLVNKDLSELNEHENNACIIIIDIDHFKNVNDKYGHPVGDELLKEFSLILKGELREQDIVARWGGEEFIIMLKNISSQDGMIIVENIRKAIENNKFLIAENEIKITASFGIAELFYLNSDSLNRAYQKADNALYKAKDNGRNQCVFEN